MSLSDGGTKMVTEQDLKNTKSFTPFEFAGIMFAGFVIVMLFVGVGCGGDPACDNGGCDPTTDGGTDTDNPSNDAGVEDAGATDTGNTSDTGSGDTEPTDPCKGYEWLNGDFDCQGSSIVKTCETWVEAGVCYAKCTDLFNKRAVDDAKLALTAPDKLVYEGPGYTATCTKK